MNGINARHGRTYRRRQMKSKSTRCTDGDNDYIELVRWMSRNGFKGALLKPANFKETGRGLMATKPFQIGDQVISIPEMLLITTQNVLSSYLGDFIKQQTRPKLSPMQVICTYLICERSRQKDSFWYNYIKVLPKSYSNPVYFTNEEINWLPRRIKRKVFDECEKINTAYRELKNLFSILESTFVSFKGIFEYSAFRWAWCTVNTRSVYMLQEQNPHLSIECDHYALAPFLDLLNHTNTVEVKASYNPVSKCYEIFTCTACKKYDQMFIYYGPHDNVKLFIEYGFVLPQNQHNVVELDFEDIYCKTCEERKLLRNKLDFFQSHNLTTKLTCSLDGLSWKLVTVLKILSIVNTDIALYKSVMLGLSLPDEYLQKALELGKNILKNEIQELMDLPKIPDSYLSNYRGNMIEQLRKEQIEILEKCLELLYAGIL